MTAVGDEALPGAEEPEPEVEFMAEVAQHAAALGDRGGVGTAVVAAGAPIGQMLAGVELGADRLFIAQRRAQGEHGRVETQVVGHSHPSEPAMWDRRPLAERLLDQQRRLPIRTANG